MSENLIYKRLAEINKEIGAIAKTDKNRQQGFNFRGIDSVYNALHDIMAKHEVFTTSEIISQETREKETKSGTTLFYRLLKIKYTFHTVDGSSVSTEIVGEGMDPGDKATNKAMSIAHKYAFLQMFTIPTEEEKDPDFTTLEPIKNDNKKRTQEELLSDGKKACIDMITNLKLDAQNKQNLIKKVGSITSVEAIKEQYKDLDNMLKAQPVAETFQGEIF